MVTIFRTQSAQLAWLSQGNIIPLSHSWGFSRRRNFSMPTPVGLIRTRCFSSQCSNSDWKRL